jgi:hypothetical protein
MGDVQKYKIRLNKTQEGIVRTDGTISDSYDKDFYITISIIEDATINEYVDVEIDPLKTEINRQFFNPYFIELGFFRDITSVHSTPTSINTSVEVKSKKYGININK